MQCLKVKQFKMGNKREEEKDPWKLLKEEWMALMSSF